MKTSFVVAAAALVHVHIALVARVYETIGQCAEIDDNIDYPEGDVSNVPASTAEDCCVKCDFMSSCNACMWSQYNGGSCYMKSKWPDAVVITNPARDGSAYLRSGIRYRCTELKPNTDFVDEDIGSAPARIPARCCGIYRSTSGCKGFSWTAYNGGTCWFKKSNRVATTYAPGVISAAIYY